MFARRRPLLRAAAVGGAAYIAGKRSGQRAEQQQYTQEQGMQPSVPQQGGEISQEAMPSVPDQLAQLSALHQQGALNDAEFAAAKSRLLDG